MRSIWPVEPFSAAWPFRLYPLPTKKRSSAYPVRFHIDQNAMRIARRYLVTGFLVASLFSPAQAETLSQQESQQAPLAKFAPPEDCRYSEDENRNHISLGRRLLVQTRKSLPENVGNGLNRTNCHLGEGRVAPAFPYFGIAAGTDRLNPQAALHRTISQREAGRLQQV
jgi:cytochrome c